MHSAAGKITAAGNGLSAAVPKTMGFRPDGMKSSGMAAHNSWQAQQQQQREKSRKDQVWVIRQPVLFWSGNIAGTGLVVIGGVFVEMDDEFVFTMGTPVDRKYFFDRSI